MILKATLKTNTKYHDYRVIKNNRDVIFTQFFVKLPRILS